MEYAQVLKMNPHHGPDGKFVEAPSKKPEKAASSGSTKVSVKPSFSARTKVTIQSATEALAKQGIKLEHAGMEGFSPKYKLTGKDGSSQTVSAKDLTKMLTKKSAFTY